MYHTAVPNENLNFFVTYLSKKPHQRSHQKNPKYQKKIYFLAICNLPLFEKNPAEIDEGKGGFKVIIWGRKATKEMRIEVTLDWGLYLFLEIQETLQSKY